MANISKMKLPNNTTYNLKDSNAGYSVAVSGSTLQLKNAAGTVISSVNLPGGSTYGIRRFSNQEQIIEIVTDTNSVKCLVYKPTILYVYDTSVANGPVKYIIISNGNINTYNESLTSTTGYRYKSINISGQSIPANGVGIFTDEYSTNKIEVIQHMSGKLTSYQVSGTPTGIEPDISGGGTSVPQPELKEYPQVQFLSIYNNIGSFFIANTESYAISSHVYDWGYSYMKVPAQPLQVLAVGAGATRQDYFYDTSNGSRLEFCIGGFASYTPSITKVERFDYSTNTFREVNFTVSPQSNNKYRINGGTMSGNLNIMRVTLDSGVWAIMTCGLDFTYKS